MRTLLCATIILGLGAMPQLASADDTDTKIWSEPSGRGFATGFGNGIWGGGLFAQDIRVRVPLGTEHLALQVRGLMVHGLALPEYRGDFGARVGILGGSLPILNLARIYGGGGVQLLAPITGVPDGADKGVKFGLSGEFGIELFIAPTMGFFFEIGGGGYFSGGYANGGSAMAGIQFYPF
jgi:hypothetical protein